ncbi:hypothetical protein CASFOL_036895 [Castilleja foliolosa]|uniref:Uncharacterized protein n=1 Tax=Castilleja foliolosa TaxID=1961234 RepID=A0ABD3BPG3_9LAMI
MTGVVCRRSDRRGDGCGSDEPSGRRAGSVLAARPRAARSWRIWRRQFLGMVASALTEDLKALERHSERDYGGGSPMTGVSACKRAFQLVTIVVCRVKVARFRGLGLNKFLLLFEKLVEI